MMGPKAEKVVKLQRTLERLLNSLVDNGFELGVQTAVYLSGELVADVCAGRVSSRSPRKVDSNTLFPICSTGKGVTATMFHILAWRGIVDYDAPIAFYWPEFGVNSKLTITCRHALSHMAGIPKMPLFETWRETCNWDLACKKVAKLTPEWDPGSKAEYHSRTFGWVVGGVMERAAGRPFRVLLRDLITQPLEIEDSMFFGISDEAEMRISPFEKQPTQKEQCSTAPTALAVASNIPPLVDFVNLPEVRRSCMPALNGIMSAKAIAKHYAALIDEVDGVRLLSESVIDEATKLQTPSNSLPKCFGHGFGLGYVLKGYATHQGAFFGHGGAGGSEGMLNRFLHMAVGVTKNRMDTHSEAPAHTGHLIINAIMSVLGNDGDGGFYSL